MHKLLLVSFLLILTSGLVGLMIGPDGKTLVFSFPDDRPWGTDINDTCFAISGAPQECEADTDSDWFGNSPEIYTPPGGLVIFF